MTTFVSLQTPINTAAAFYDPTNRHDSQPEEIPGTFLDAMSVREDVYVDEQHVPLENEFDTEDAQSYHWISYASIASTTSSPDSDKQFTDPFSTKGQAANKPSHNDPDAKNRKGSAHKLAVGTIRLVPPPHSHDASSHNEGPDMRGSSLPAEQAEAKGCLRRGSEPYVKLGRLAVLKPYRKLGLSSLLVHAALQYAANHPDEIIPPLSPTEAEQKKLQLGGSGADLVTTWEGLVLVHAQTGVEKLWKAWGFVRDETMGTWNEEGIDHVGMWRRINVYRRKASAAGTEY